MNKEELKGILPHREPMLLIDEAEIDAEGVAHGVAHIRGDEWFLQGHFPGNPIVPGVIQCEMAAQCCAVLFAEKIKGATPVFTGINKVKFRTQVKPGDTMRFDCTATREVGAFCFTECKAYVNEKLAMSGEFSFAVIR